ncbi:unnamed protein product [Rotaria magnacalcarata]
MMTTICSFLYDVNEDEREEDFVEQTDYTTATNNYRVGRVKFSIVEDSIQLKWKNIKMNVMDKKIKH